MIVISDGLLSGSTQLRYLLFFLKIFVIDNNNAVHDLLPNLIIIINVYFRKTISLLVPYQCPYFKSYSIF